MVVILLTDPHGGRTQISPIWPTRRFKRNGGPAVPLVRRACHVRRYPPWSGECGTAVTEQVYRHQIRPVVQAGAVAMDGLFGTS
jgi:hypothetical protein